MLGLFFLLTVYDIAAFAILVFESKFNPSSINAVVSSSNSINSKTLVSTGTKTCHIDINGSSELLVVGVNFSILTVTVTSSPGLTSVLSVVTDNVISLSFSSAFALTDESRIPLYIVTANTNAMTAAKILFFMYFPPAHSFCTYIGAKKSYHYIFKKSILCLKHFN